MLNPNFSVNKLIFNELNNLKDKGLTAKLLQRDPPLYHIINILQFGPSRIYIGIGCMGFNKFTTWADFFTHQNREGAVGFCRIHKINLF